MWSEQNANSVAWNSEFEDMLCYSGNGMLSIRTADFPLHQQKLQVGVCGTARRGGRGDKAVAPPEASCGSTRA